MNKQRKIRIHLFISGIVQGVNFRYYTREQAKNMGLMGWVRNLSDGRVEMVAEGEEKDAERLAEWCKNGPPGARVENVARKDEPYTGEFREFKIEHGRL